METYNAIALAVSGFVTGLFLGHAMKRRVPGGKIDFLIDTTLSNQQKLNQIMPTLAEISAKADELQSALDAEQEQIAAAKTELTTKLDEQAALIVELRAAIESNGTEEERAAILGKLDASIADVKSTVEDLPTGPVEGGEPTV